MKPARFAYHRPTSLDDALALLAEHSFDAKVIAGGQSLAPMMNMRIAQPQHLVDVNGLTELHGIEAGAGELRVGALTRHHELATDPVVRAACPLLSDAAATVGHYAIRQRGTLGGSLANADPAAQLPLIACTLDARIEVAGPAGRREIAGAEFVLAPMTTALEPDEIVVAVRFPRALPDEAHGFELFSLRRGDFAIASVATTVRIDAGRIVQLRLGVGGVGDAPVALDGVCASAPGRSADAATLDALAREAAAAVDPYDQPDISAAYRRELVGTLTTRALARACGLRSASSH